MSRHFCHHPLCANTRAGVKGFPTSLKLNRHHQRPHLKRAAFRGRVQHKTLPRSIDVFVALGFEAETPIGDRTIVRSVAERLTGRLVPGNWWLDEGLVLELKVRVAQYETGGGVS